MSKSELDNRHPIFTGEYAIFTPPINQMINTLGDWIDQRFTGGYIYGPSRFGKSRAIKWFVRLLLTERFGLKLPMFIWIRPPTKITEREFWNQLLAATQFEFISPLKPKTKVQARFLFKEQIITLAKSARKNYVALIIDEAQDVTLEEYKWLMGLQNELDDEGFRFSVFSIGSHQIEYKPDYMARTGNAHLAARFFPDDAKYNGISSVEELKYVLVGYDEDSDWPQGTHTSYLKYFSPKEFLKGNRLANHAEDLWGCFADNFPNEVKKGVKNYPLELPMLHVSKTIEMALISLSEGKEWEEVTKRDNWNVLIHKTKFLEHIKAIRAPI